ncbi:transposase [Acidithrix sp. C25]|uniref:Transposase n=2 Tax=root TaxID=1 RepID=A0A0D8HL52_9ACTN|nr:transposase [Acidithrix sp. C25]KJF18462.1 transposase [Acidithrix ferrooxidans]
MKVSITNRIGLQLFLDVRRGVALDVVAGRGGANPKAWIESQEQSWRDGVKWGTLDLSGGYKAVFRKALPKTTLVADPFHLIKLANQRIDETRRRVQNELYGSRARAGDPLYRIRRLLTMADERLTSYAKDKLVGLLKADDPGNEVATAWQAKEALRELYTISDPSLKPPVIANYINVKILARSDK